MEIFTIIYVLFKDATPTKKAIYTVDNEDAAVKTLHTNMGQYMAVENVKSICAVAMNSTGAIYKIEHWEA